jgi:hypothetical protein
VEAALEECTEVQKTHKLLTAQFFYHKNPKLVKEQAANSDITEKEKHVSGLKEEV